MQNENERHGDIDVIDGFLSALRFTHQARREISEWLPEIAYREGVSVSDIINGAAILAILNDAKMNAPQKSKKILGVLYRMRFPEYSRMQDKWKKAAAAANPCPSKIRFIPSPGFEKKRLEIRLSAVGADEALAIIKSLSEIDERVWDDLLWPRINSNENRIEQKGSMA